MYEELVTDIRYCVSGDNPCGECKHIEELCCDTTLLEKAADAIEKLQKDLERSKEYEAFWQHEAEEALKKFQVAISNKPKWIPVTERLPLLMTTVLITDGIEVDIAWMFGVPARWAEQYTDMDADSITHWMELPKTPLPEPPKEE